MMMMWKVRIRLLIDRVKSLFQKKKAKPRFSGSLDQFRPRPAKKSVKDVAGAILWAFLTECGMIVWEDIKYVMSRRKQSPEEAWQRALEQVQKVK